jgi:hypothetical protein
MNPAEKCFEVKKSESLCDVVNLLKIRVLRMLNE